MSFRINRRHALKDAPFLSILLTAMCMNGCMYFYSWDENVGRRGIRMSILDITWPGPDSVTTRADGLKEYEYHPTPSCAHYWVVDPDGKIVGYRYRGSCRPVG